MTDNLKESSSPQTRPASAFDPALNAGLGVLDRGHAEVARACLIKQTELVDEFILNDEAFKYGLKERELLLNKEGVEAEILVKEKKEKVTSKENYKKAILCLPALERILQVANQGLEIATQRLTELDNQIFTITNQTTKIQREIAIATSRQNFFDYLEKNKYKNEEELEDPVVHLRAGIKTLIIAEELGGDVNNNFAFYQDLLTYKKSLEQEVSITNFGKNETEINSLLAKEKFTPRTLLQTLKKVISYFPEPKKTDLNTSLNEAVKEADPEATIQNAEELYTWKMDFFGLATSYLKQLYQVLRAAEDMEKKNSPKAEKIKTLLGKNIDIIEIETFMKNDLDDLSLKDQFKKAQADHLSALNTLNQKIEETTRTFYQNQKNRQAQEVSLSGRNANLTDFRKEIKKDQQSLTSLQKAITTSTQGLLAEDLDVNQVITKHEQEKLESHLNWQDFIEIEKQTKQLFGDHNESLANRAEYHTAIQQLKEETILDKKGAFTHRAQDISDIDKLTRQNETIKMYLNRGTQSKWEKLAQHYKHQAEQTKVNPLMHALPYTPDQRLKNMASGKSSLVVNPKGYQSLLYRDLANAIENPEKMLDKIFLSSAGLMDFVKASKQSPTPLTPHEVQWACALETYYSQYRLLNGDPALTAAPLKNKDELISLALHTLVTYYHGPNLSQRLGEDSRNMNVQKDIGYYVYGNLATETALLKSKNFLGNDSVFVQLFEDYTLKSFELDGKKIQFLDSNFHIQHQRYFARKVERAIQDHPALRSQIELYHAVILPMEAYQFCDKREKIGLAINADSEGNLCLSVLSYLSDKDFIDLVKLGFTDQADKVTLSENQFLQTVTLENKTKHYVVLELDAQQGIKALNYRDSGGDVTPFPPDEFAEIINAVNLKLSIHAAERGYHVFNSTPLNYDTAAEINPAIRAQLHTNPIQETLYSMGEVGEVAVPTKPAANKKLASP